MMAWEVESAMKYLPSLVASWHSHETDLLKALRNAKVNYACAAEWYKNSGMREGGERESERP